MAKPINTSVVCSMKAKKRLNLSYCHIQTEMATSIEKLNFTVVPMF